MTWLTTHSDGENQSSPFALPTDDVRYSPLRSRFRAPLALLPPCSVITIIPERSPASCDFPIFPKDMYDSFLIRDEDEIDGRGRMNERDFQEGIEKDLRCRCGVEIRREGGGSGRKGGRYGGEE